ncbi:uncharacterized protein LOC108455207 [Gossypium arboreum]|uniref:uncharacterized protein LOC108455207 n=1 Tax=Gossypium arboreum TaxID=29729 RepID=UPI0008197603|nr:uncharacterized protein LOC108455207 [Gossypium arboreum]
MMNEWYTEFIRVNLNAQPPPPPPIPQSVPMVPQGIDLERRNRLLVEKIRKHGAEEFRANKDDDPERAEFWLENTIRVFDEQSCTSEECLKCAISLLRDSAYYRWKTLVSLVPHEMVTWEFFQEEFRNKYISERFMDQKHKEFLNLKQGCMTIAEYEREFIRLSKYARECVSSEAKMHRRFEDGLNEDIRLSMGVLELKEFVVLVDQACKAEELIKEKKKTEVETRDARKRHASKSFPSQSKKSRDTYSRSHTSIGCLYRDCKKQDLDFKSRATSMASVDNVRSSKPECQHCGRNHFGKCRMKDGSCFWCSSQDHFIKDCPKMIDKEKFQGTRPSGTNSKGRLQKNV